MDDQRGSIPVMTPVMTRVIVRSDAPSDGYDHWVRHARHRGRHLRSLGMCGMYTGWVHSKCTQVGYVWSLVSGLYTGLSGDPSVARDGAPTSARDGAQPVPETAPNQCPRRRLARHRFVRRPGGGPGGGGGRRLGHWVVRRPGGGPGGGASGGHGHGETSHELPTVLTDHRHRLRGRAEDRAGVACRVECECHVMSRETGPAVRLLVQYLVRATLVSRL
jgi:hypothetical protein